MAEQTTPGRSSVTVLQFEEERHTISSFSNDVYDLVVFTDAKVTIHFDCRSAAGSVTRL